jgi:hypothetical protein
MSIKGKLGEFIPAANSPLAPLVFIAGGMKRTKEGQPAEYMLKRGFGNLKQFNIYNIAQTDFSEYGKQDTNVLDAWGECKSILKSQGITPSKFILVGFSLGAAHIEPLVTGQDGGQWDLVISAGAYMMKQGSTYTDQIKMIDKLTEYEDGNITKPKSSRFVYIHAGGVKDSDPLINGDHQLLSIQKKLERRIPSGNTYEHDTSNHMKSVNAAADWLNANVIVSPDGTSKINIPTTKKQAREKVKTKKEQKVDETKVEEGIPKGSETGAAEKCNVEEKNNAVFKSQSDPKDAGEIKKDTPPPSKNEKPQFTSNKYNHRFYIKPTIGLRDAAFETPPSNPAELQKMVEKSGPWYNRYWAYRLNSGPNYGFEKYETTISDNGIELITAVIPYWKPPFDEKNPKDDAKVKGEWNKLIEGYDTIQSPIDVPILLNAYQVGVFNDNIEYIYEAENELHMTILESEIINKGKLAIGQGLNDSDALKKVQDSSWANYPRWSGIFASHCLRNSGFTLQEDLGLNIDFYHRSILSRDRLVNHPGNKKMPWKEMKTLGTHNKIFKPSKIWLEPKYLSEEEYFENDEKSSIAIFVIGYHINRNGTLTDRGKKLVNHINKGLRWDMATISAVPHSTVNSSQCFTDVLLYMDEDGTIVTLGGNTNVPGANSSIKSGNHIAVKVTNFSKFIPNLETFGVNASIIVARTKSTPALDFFRSGNGLDQKLVVNTDSIFNQYIGKVESTTSREKINDEYYKKLMPYIVFGESDCFAGTTGDVVTNPSEESPTEEPEYLPDIIVESAEMDKVNTDNCEQLRQKYNLTKSDTNIQGISATGVEGEIDNTDCKGGLTPLQIANLMAALAGSESSNIYSIKGGGGGNFTGRYQFGKAALIDTGFLKKGGNINNPASWTGKLGIKSRQDFMDCPIVQEIAMQEYLKINYNYLYKAGSKIEKGVLDNIPCNELAGLLAVAHLVGFGAAQKYFKSGGKTNNKDAFGMSAAKYYQLGYGAASGKFQNQKLGRHRANTGEKYFLYPSVLQNGLGLGVNAPVIVNPQPQPEPNPDATDGFDGDMFFKVNPQDIVFYAKSITTVTKVPVLIKEMQEKYGKKNAINCSFFNGNDTGGFIEDSVVPPYKDEIFSDMRVKPGRAGVATSFWIKNGVATIGASNAVPSDAKYVVAGKPVCIQNGIPRTETSVFNGSGRPKSPTGRVAIGIYNDGSVFIYAAQKKTAIQARNAILKYANGNNESGGDLKDVIFLDGGGSPFLYVNNKMIFPNDGRGINNIIAW